ncbi:MAG: InlB B-repeat-containing protein, partial [Minisyncoccia bacterium]
SYSYSVKSFINISASDILSDASNSSAATTKVTLTVTPSAGGSISGSGINCGSSCSNVFRVGDEVTLAATPTNSSYNFTDWTGGPCDNSTSTTCAFTISADTSVTANFIFIPPQMKLTVSNAPSAGGSILGNGNSINCGTVCSEYFNENSSISLTAAPAAGYTFSKWTGDACNNSTSTSCFIFSINGDMSVTANFAPIQEQVTLTVSKSPSGVGSVSGSGIDCGSTCSVILNKNSLVSITATAAPLAAMGPITGYSFSKWTGDVCNNSTNATCNFTITGNTSVTARFILVQIQSKTNHLYADLYDSARGWLARQGERLKLIGNNLWGGLISFLENGRQFIADNFYRVEVGLGQTQPTNYNDYFNLNKFSFTAPFYLNAGLDSNSVYLYRVRVVYNDGATPTSSLWSYMLAGKTLDGSASPNGLFSPICTSNSFCDRTVAGFKVIDGIGNIIEQSEAQCQVNADCKNVGRASRTLEEK